MNEEAIKKTLYDWLVSELGVRQVISISLDADLVPGNLFDIDINLIPIQTVMFTEDHATTMNLIATEIQKSESVGKVEVTAPREITVTGKDAGVIFTVANGIVTGGASQANVTIAELVTAVAIPVIFADPVDDTGRNAPRPPYPYATIRLDSITQIGNDDWRDLNAVNGVANIGGQRRATVTVEYLGPDPIQNIMQAYNSLERESLIFKFDINGIAYLEKDEVTNLTELLETRFEERSSFDFFIGFADNIDDELGIIETVELAGDINGDPVGPITISG